MLLLLLLPWRMQHLLWGQKLRMLLLLLLR
jgi:hypothetical protein